MSQKSNQQIQLEIPQGHSQPQTQSQAQNQTSKPDESHTNQPLRKPVS